MTTVRLRDPRLAVPADTVPSSPVAILSKA